MNRPTSHLPRWRHILALLFCLGTPAALLLLAAHSYLNDGLVAIMTSTQLTSSDKVTYLQQFFREMGPAAPVVYVLFVIVEVTVAPIPGAMLYAPGGVIFGGFWGGLLSLVGNVLGAGLACQIMRVARHRLLERCFSRELLGRYESRLADSGLWLVAILRVNPLTSSDLVSYAAGLTRMPTWKVMLGTLIGMAPLCWAQSFLADNVLTLFPQLIMPLMITGVVYMGVVILILKKLLAGKPEEATSTV